MTGNIFSQKASQFTAESPVMVNYTKSLLLYSLIKEHEDETLHMSVCV